jgi:CMP/dCMP kinase
LGTADVPNRLRSVPTEASQEHAAETIQVAIDGPSGAGKSTVSRALARALRGDYVDTGAAYRALTWALLERGVDVHDPAMVERTCHEPQILMAPNPDDVTVMVDGHLVTHEIRSDRVTDNVSAVASVPAVRARLVELQRDVAHAARAAGRAVVMEGRDIGTVVLPQATLKVWLTADVRARAQRRAAEGVRHAHDITPDDVDEAEVLAKMTRRDGLDSGRSVSPSVAAPDSVEVDATHLSVDEVVNTILGLLKLRGDERP